VPNIASAKKNMRKTRAATVRNRAQRSALRTALKKARAPGAVASAKLLAVKLLDRAARKGIIHRNAAARHKSTRPADDVWFSDNGALQLEAPAVAPGLSAYCAGVPSECRQLPAAPLAIPLRRIVHRAALVALERLVPLQPSLRSQDDRVCVGHVRGEGTGFRASRLGPL